MTKSSWGGGDFRSLAAVCLCAALMLVASPALGATHPARHLTVAQRVVNGRLVTQTAPESGKARRSSRATPGNKKRAGKSHPKNAAAKPAPKSKWRKVRPQDEADNDPPVLHRARGVKLRRKAVAPRDLAALQMALRAANETVAESETISPENFSHGTGSAASVAPAAVAETVDPGAEVYALPKSVTPAPIKHSAMPEDHAGRAAVIEQAMTPIVMPTLHTRRGKLVVPPPMKGSWDILVHQNTMADSEGLGRIQDDDDLDRLRAQHLLVPLPSRTGLSVNVELPQNRRYARPWAARFAADTGRAFYARFHQPLRLNSAVRTVEYQLRLQRVNGNAAAVDGDGASPHLTGQALDFGKRGMSIVQIAWMRAYLAPLMQAGKLDVEEEFQQACFHISVYRNYLPMVKAKASSKVEVAQLHADAPVGKVRAGAKAEDGLR